jgi:hypothetical protein
MNNGYIFSVITKVPKNSDDGNKYDDLLIRDRKKEADPTSVANLGYRSYREVCESDDMVNIPDDDVIDVSLSVFSLGEILILESTYGREIAGKGRKPSKWSVDTKEFDNLDDAIECARKVLLEEE